MKRRDNSWHSVKQALPVLGLMAVVALILVASAFVFEPPGERQSSIIFALGFCALIFILVVFKRAGEIFGRFVAGYLVFSVMLLVALGPALLFYWLSRVLLDRLPAGGQWTLLFVWGLLLACALLPISTKGWRDWTLEPLTKVSVALPAAYSFNVLILAVLFFSTASVLMVERNLLAFTPGPSLPDGAVTAGRLSDFFLWHFLAAVPVLRITETLRWDVPLTYTASSVGWILLLFKVTVIAPVIAAFAWYSRRQRPAPAAVAVSSPA